MSNEKNSVASLSEFIGVISELNSNWKRGQLLYRGHKADFYKAEPSVLRKIEWQDREEEMLRRLMAQHPDEFVGDSSAFDKLTRAQHFGLPTRLLDVTKNPLVALYFACKELTEEELNSLPATQNRSRIPNGEVVVFYPSGQPYRFFDSETVACLSNLTYLTLEVKNSIREHLIECRESAFVEAKTEAGFSTLYESLFNKHEGVQELVRLVKIEKPGLERIKPVSLTNIVTVIPRRSNTRISLQSGAFLVFGLFNPERDGETYLFPEQPDRSEIYIPSWRKAAILGELSNLGINKETLFPSLEETANNIKSRSY